MGERDGKRPVIAVSACLLGYPCRYDGASKPCADVMALAERFELVPLCPEVAGGMGIPHPPCEIDSASAQLRVIDRGGLDVTERFVEGARRCSDAASRAGCRVAVMKAKSPSCGSGQVYDGTFSDSLVPGWGVAAALLRDCGIRVIDETQLDALFGASGTGKRDS